MDNPDEVLVAERKESGEDETLVYFFRYSFARDEVTASFYLTETELAKLLQQLEGKRPTDD